jgi:hypothetical protein
MHVRRVRPMASGGGSKADSELYSFKTIGNGRAKRSQPVAPSIFGATPCCGPRELFDYGRSGPPELRFDEVASTILFWPVG